MERGAIFLLTDRPDRSASLEKVLHGVAHCEVVGGGQKPLAGATPVAVVADLTLTRRESADLLRSVMRENKDSGLPVIALMRSNTDNDIRQARNLGATICLPAYTEARVVAQALTHHLTPAADVAELPIARGVTRATEVLTGLFGQIRDGGPIAMPIVEAGLDPILAAVREGGLTRWLDTVWTHDDATYQHCLLVAGVAAQFVLHLGFREDDRRHFVRAALLHDVGKAQIPLAILNKPGRLDADEMAVMRTHPVIGYEILLNSGCDAATLGAVRHHHEMLDGSGYPDGLVGDAIADTVRLLTICDIYAALTERRAYKPPMPPRDALAILQGMDGKLEMSLVRHFGEAMLPAG
ncbi:HD domain-containing protein [Methylobacterium sp. BTF04]|uniref:HD-GYP domain-containing protein n=1 Tax=Methylobacterium sp. BTF04 TaxID=2708300 RepID=UPI0013CFC8E7|nr:HD domain-containing phosphohydrolase [Methylobacterium sp. BTF04]NEU14295.1 HD domain-containing protein [Methylobacterium sp. BTF04]